MSEAKSEITFNRPMLVGQELEYVRQAVGEMHISAGGPFTRKCSRILAEQLGVPHVVLTTSCTDALEMVALLLELGRDDEFIVPSYAFVSTANAFALRGARPVFADIRPDTLNLDESLVEPLITSKTRAVVALHYAGVACEMNPLLELCDRRGIPLIEDNAHGLFGTYRGRCLGSFGRMATLSFHETKNFTCGEGGALILGDEELIERAEILRDKGTDRQKLFRGEVGKYTWVDLGSSFGMSDILAAFLYAQLECRGSVMAKRRALWENYDSLLRGWIEKHGVRLPIVPEHCGQAYHMYYLLCESADVRRRLIEHLRSRRISGVFHYTPLHLSRMGRAFGGRAGDCPVTESAGDRLLRLPFFNELQPTDQERVVSELRRFFCGG